VAGIISRFTTGLSADIFSVLSRLAASSAKWSSALSDGFPTKYCRVGFDIGNAPVTFALYYAAMGDFSFVRLMANSKLWRQYACHINVPSGMVQAELSKMKEP
jgi:hypothetical protein